MLSGDNSILQKAAEAKTLTERAKIIEQARTDILGFQAENRGRDIDKTQLKTVLDKYFDGVPDLTDMEKDAILNTQLNTLAKYGTHSIAVSEIYNGSINGENIFDIVDYEVGDYVDYSPNPTQSSYTISSIYSGYENNQTFLAENEDDGLYWRVLNLNSNGSVDLVASRFLNCNVYFGGEQAYNNGVYLLNEMCKTFYSNSNLNAEARSINIEDIQEHLANEDIYKEYETNVMNGFGGTVETLKYGDTYEYTGNISYPIRWSSDNGTIGESESGSSLITGTTVIETNSKLTVTNTTWGNNSFVPTFESNLYQQLLQPTPQRYLIASRFVECYSISTVKFGLRQYGSGYLGPGYTYSSKKNNSSLEGTVLPIVTIPSSAIHKIDNPTNN